MWALDNLSAEQKQALQSSCIESCSDSGCQGTSGIFRKLQTTPGNLSLPPNMMENMMYFLEDHYLLLGHFCQKKNLASQIVKSLEKIIFRNAKISVPKMTPSPQDVTFLTIFLKGYLREAFIRKKITFVISGLAPPPSPLFWKKMMNYFYFFFLVLDHIWVTFGKKYFFAPWKV